VVLCEGVAVAGFTGFSDQALELYAGLEADNSKAFWTDHKAVWESQVRDPMQALLDELEDEFGPGKLFRPYRDVRFSKDKTPYKTHQGALVGRVSGVGWYLQVDAEGLLAGGGWRAHEPAQVHRFRAAVDDEVTGPEIAGVVAALKEQGFDVRGDELSRAPRGYPADHPRIDLLRCRSLMVSRRYGAPDWLGTSRAADEVRAAWRVVRPLADWVDTHIAG
jgi:uncharacterized protein (TIGR02453 family)